MTTTKYQIDVKEGESEKNFETIYRKFWTVYGTQFRSLRTIGNTTEVVYDIQNTAVFLAENLSLGNGDLMLIGERKNIETVIQEIREIGLKAEEYK